MKVIRGTRNLDKSYPNPIVTLGNFDGVHIGHKEIFKKVVSRTKEINGTSIVYTFEPHPLKVLSPDKSPPLLTTFHKKMALIMDSGIDITICADFTSRFADQKPRDFAMNIISEAIGSKELFVGYDYSFGKGREGTITYLKNMGCEMGFKVNVIDPVKVNEYIVSSSVIRNMVLEKDVETASVMLGRYYSIDGKVVKSTRRGTKLGYPTANIDTVYELIPGVGVYLVKVMLDGIMYDGVANVGYNPTFSRYRLEVEVHIFDFNTDIYHRDIEVYFIKYLRNERTFNDVEGLKEQIRMDIEVARKLIEEQV